MSDSYAIEVEHLTVRYYNIQKYSVKKMLLHGKRNERKEFEAVRDLSFRVREGEILGITGENGCGKSTTLNTLAGIFAPNEGRVDIKGHSISLLSIGVGFQSEMSGRDNIYLSGMLLGFSERQIRAQEEAIIAFSELGEFIDEPVRTYSSGMYSKLAYAITSTLETDIILIDEVLSVGDSRFRKKSYQRMKELISDKRRTVVMVSHSDSTLRELCDRVMWMQAGSCRMIGAPGEVLDAYNAYMVGERKGK